MSTRRVTLTFDNGPTPGVTDRVLDLLDAHGVAVTFFVIGEKVARDDAHRALVARAWGAGHWIGNHTYTHRGLMGGLPDADAAQSEIQRTQDLIAPFAHPDQFYRPCGGGGQLCPGLLTEGALTLLTSCGYSLVLWNAVPRDWIDPDGWPARALGIIEGLANTAQDWPLVVLHDIENGALARLGSFLTSLSAGGFTVVQALPPACLPIRRGRVVGEVAGFLG